MWQAVCIAKLGVHTHQLMSMKYRRQWAECMWWEPEWQSTNQKKNRKSKGVFSVLPHLCCIWSKKSLQKKLEQLHYSSILHTKSRKLIVHRGNPNQCIHHIISCQYARPSLSLMKIKKNCVFFLLYLLEDVFEKEIDILCSVWRSWLSHTITFHFSFVILICNFEEYVLLTHHLINFLAENRV